MRSRVAFIAVLSGVLCSLAQSVAAAVVYWNVFNREEETDLGARIVTYATLDDMLNDTNRLGVVAPDGFSPFAEQNIVGSGSDGTTFWNVFNREGETDLGARFATYATLDDMLNDTNRLGVFAPDGFSSFAEQNIVGSGAFFIPDPVPVPAPPMLLVLLAGYASLLLARRARQAPVRARTPLPVQTRRRGRRRPRRRECCCNTQTWPSIFSALETS